MIGLQFDNLQMEGNLVYAGGCMLATGLDLQTATLISLGCDARAQPSDPLPDGTPRRGWWADSYDEDGDALGSMLWLLADQKATSDNAARAELYAQAALKWLLDDGHVRAIATESAVQIDAIWLKVTYILPNGQQVSLSPFKVN